MAQTHKPKPPLDVLQSMLNGILIETGRALRSSEKESGRTFATANTRMKTTIPSAIDNFHLALDELECDLLRAKAVIQRDLAEKRAERIARENPTIIPEPQIIEEDAAAAILTQEPPSVDIQRTITPPPLEQQHSPEPELPKEPTPIPQPIPVSISNPPTTPGMLAANPSQQAPAPPDSTAQAVSKPIALGISTEGIPPPINTAAAAAETSTAPVSSVDSLFDMPLDGDNDVENLGADPTDDLFSAMDFSNTADNLDLSSFDNNNATTDDFTTDADANKQLNDILDAGGADPMDLDLSLDLDMRMAEESTFDDLIWGNGDGDGDGEGGGGDGMETSEFDEAFFRLDD